MIVKFYCVAFTWYRKDLLTYKGLKNNIASKHLDFTETLKGKN